ncbi:hypothetical protein [Actinomadura rugatobispora]|uniref:Prenyltransferase n=1 Tax=Actinomadura rugatobispora TaxID=1994 RepID=A0ABW1AIF6_9ACTN|nr:hypothetical protein GCM10010200_075570 [Actinomadura rugatobispora]
MKTLHVKDLDAAEEFLRLNARLIDRRRFAFHFRGGPAAAVVAALRPYENPDGGYGHALEPDLRGEASQPVPAQHALEILHEAGADGDPAVGRIGDFLASITRPGGGVPFVLPTVRDAPRAPWWQTTDDPPASINPTATLAGLLHLVGSGHPWVGPATEFSWAYLEKEGNEPGPYDALAILCFLDHAPERARAEAVFERYRDALLKLVSLEPGAGEDHSPLDFAPEPGGFGRRLFDDDLVEAHLDALVDERLDDGGWTVHFPFWTPITEPEWRGYITLERLKTLRAYDRLRT